MRASPAALGRVSLRTSRTSDSPATRHARANTALEPLQRAAQTFELVAQLAVLPQLLLDLTYPRPNALNDRADARYLGHHPPSSLTSCRSLDNRNRDPSPSQPRQLPVA